MLNDDLDELTPINIHQLGIEDSETEDMTDQKFLEMSNHFKQLIDEKENEYRSLVRNLKNDREMLVKCYGVISLISDLFDGLEDIDRIGTCIEVNLECIVSKLKCHLEISD